HVAEAIMWFRGPPFVAQSDRHQSRAPKLKLVYKNQQAHDPAARLVALAERLQSKAANLDRYADLAASEADAQDLRKAADLSRMLIGNLMLQIELVRSGKPAR